MNHVVDRDVSLPYSTCLSLYVELEKWYSAVVRTGFSIRIDKCFTNLIHSFKAINDSNFDKLLPNETRHLDACGAKRHIIICNSRNSLMRSLFNWVIPALPSVELNNQTY